MKADEQVDVAEAKTSSPMFTEKDGMRNPSSAAELGHGDVEKVETTKRGLKARHAQMIALGGTIGECLQYPNRLHQF